MNMKRIFIGIVSMLAWFLFVGQFRDTVDFSFYLSTSKIFSSGESPKIQCETINYIGKINFRAYKINNPLEYFENLSDPHNPDIRNLNSSNVFNILNNSMKKITRDIRLTARNLLSSEVRKNLKEALNIGEKKDSIRQKHSDIPGELSECPIVLEWTEDIRKSENYWNYHTLDVKINNPGVYLIEGKALGRKVAYTVVIISDYAMVTKNTDKNLLSFLANKKNGAVVKNYPVSFYLDKKKIESKESDNQGIAMFNIPEKQTEPAELANEFDFWDNQNRKFFLMGYKDEHFVISEPYFYSYYSKQSKYNVYIYTERPVYRPGQEAFFKGMFRVKDDEGSWKNYTDKFVKIKISDPRGSIVYNDSLKTNSYGTINGSIKLEQEAAVGNYWIETSIEGISYSSGFEVEEYKKPEYKVEVAFDKDFYIKGNSISATINADYYFGSPVTGANVEYFIYKSRYYRPWYYGSEDSWFFEGEDYDYEYHQELVESGSGTLNDQGKLTFSYYTNNLDKDDYIYTITANVTDESRRVISGSKKVKVMRGYFSLSTTTDKYVYSPNDNVTLKVIAEDFSKNPVMTNFQVKINLNNYEQTETWVNGVRRYEYKLNRKNLTTLYGATDKSGIGYINYKTTQNGYMEVFVYAKDSKGNEITYTDYIYVSDYDYYGSWGSDAGGNIKIIPDKNSYTEGDVIKALVVAPSANLDVLITTERDKINSYQVEHFNGNSKIVEIPVKAGFTPNVFMNVSLLYNNEYYNVTKKIIIPPKNKFLHLEVLNDKQVYRPGEKGKLQVKVTSSEGKPVKNAEVSIGIVDESIYAIAPENTIDIKKQFYATRPNMVQSSSSIFFNFYGYSRDIRKDEYADMFDKKSEKLFAQTTSRERIAFGDLKGEMFAETVVRKDFRDMILWQPNAMTDGNGIAEVNVNYPDNLTTWRTTARAITTETEVGSAINKVISRKNLIVRLETPRFLIEKDQATMAVIVHNYLNTEKNVKVSLAGENIEVLGTEKSIKVPKNGQVRIDYEVNTNYHFGNAKFTAKALTNEESDAIELNIPIIPHGIELAEGQTISIENSNETKNASFIIPENTNIYSSKYSVNLSPSLASTILGSLDDLIGYPYGCVEQTMSRFLPTIIVANSLQDLGMPVSDKMRNEMPKMVDKGLKRLYSFQHSSDGGWGWWKDDMTDPFMTAYVVYGLSLAKRAKYEIDNAALSKGMWNLKYWLDNKKELDQTTKAYIVYVMAFANEREKILENQIINNQLTAMSSYNLNNYGKSLLALAYSYQGDKNKAYACLDEVEKNASYDGANVYWKGKSWHYNWQDDEIETTAYALKALINLKGDNQNIQKGINWLIGRKFGNSWNSTKQTAMVIFALVDYLKNSKELKPNYTIKVFLNDQVVCEKKMTKDDVFAKESKIYIDSKYLRIGQNKIMVQKYGEGKLYFSSRIQYFSPEENIQPKISGYDISREYYKLILRREGDRFVYAKEPMNGSIKSGDLIFVKLNLRANEPREYFMLEDPIPAGCEVINNTQGYIIPGERGYEQSYYYYWNWWFSGKEVRDEKVAFFSKNLNAGNYNFTYIMRAQIPGDYHVMPAKAALMYYPEVRGNSNERYLKILP